MSILTNVQAYNLLKAVNFNQTTAYNCYCAIDGSDRDYNWELLTRVQQELVFSKSVFDAITEKTDVNFRIDVRSFNDGNNIFDEYFIFDIVKGLATVTFFNTSYIQQGLIITKKNAAKYQDQLIEAMQAEFKSTTPTCNIYTAVLLSFARGLSEG